MPSRFRCLPVRTRVRRGVHMLESVIASMLVAILVVTSLQVVGASLRRERHTADHVRGWQLASSLMNEILLQRFADPLGVLGTGLEDGEATGDRSRFDDVDDYDGWTATPPTDRSGTPIAGYEGWTRQVEVRWADPDTLAPTAAINTGLKVIRVAAIKDGVVVASLVGFRGISWTDTLSEPEDVTGNQAPVAVATSPDLTRRVGETVTLDGSGSSDPDGDYLSYVWDFGDGTTGAGKLVTTKYSTAGNFTCTLTVYDGRGGHGRGALTAVISP